MSDDEVMRFDITEDDLDQAYNPGFNRRQSRQSKNKATYGVFAGSSGKFFSSNQKSNFLLLFSVKSKFKFLIVFSRQIKGQIKIQIVFFRRRR